MYLFFDTETGGLTPDYSLLTVSAIITDRNFEIVTVHDMDPGVYMRLKYANYVTHPKAMEVNGLNLRDHDEHGFTVEEASEVFESFVKEGRAALGASKLIPAGHNVPFDMRFVQAYLMPDSQWSRYFTHPAFDTCAIARFLTAANLITGGCGLPALREKFSIYTGAAHNAENDNLATVTLAKKFLELMPKQMSRFTKGASEGVM
jgi:DNA polymerase III epsilon subunit-like protein